MLRVLVAHKRSFVVGVQWHNQNIQDLCNFVGDTSEEEILEGLLMLSYVKLSYDTRSYKILDVDVINVEANILD